ncbi:probable G-protein coupled receptor Mth-like 3 isoform X2 [Drosophila biarmipes]|uniref:probable G-protein coupled receptor Mth-like 3 isoform X2 n=1 Tax=Drosophila biarmipes TaxID=125945 RepID=UPI0021CC6B75|nr:probable G-protein coupled receptor Mth-like 3 isoform X2 [Drosophila biarmipes]
MEHIVVFFATVILLSTQVKTTEIQNCDFYDTVNINNAQMYSNGSYLYDGLLIPAELTGEYNFMVLPDGSKKNVPSHMRGCVCKLKPCLRFCCFHNLKTVRNPAHSVCNSELSRDELESHNRYVNVTLSNGTVAKRHFKEDLIVQSDLPLPCAGQKMFRADHTLPDNGFTLFENGTFLRHWGHKFLEKRQYCVQHNEFKDENIRIAPHFCEIDDASPWGKIVVLTISLICMALTISVYLYVKKLRNLHGKCFVCYMVALFMGYLLLLLNLWEVWELKSGSCTTVGFLGYFFILAAFSWLSVISLHLWVTLALPPDSIYRFLPEHRFRAYNIYAWGLALAFTGVTFLADRVIENDNWRPRIGTNQCWIYTVADTAILYLYGPILLLIAFNITMFILTALSIEKVKNCVKSNRTRSEKEVYTLYLRLFITMGLSWTLEIISFLVRHNELWSKILRGADYLNRSQGTIIFVLFILKPSTLELIKNHIFNLPS